MSMLAQCHRRILPALQQAPLCEKNAPKATEISNIILAICAIGTLAVQFWTARKPVETKILILRWLLEISGFVAVIATGYFLCTSKSLTLPGTCAFYNFVAQAAIFAMSAHPIARRDILSIVLAAVFFVLVPMYVTTNALLKVQEMMVKTDANIISSLNKVYETLGMPSPSPSPQTPKAK